MFQIRLGEGQACMFNLFSLRPAAPRALPAPDSSQAHSQGSSLPSAHHHPTQLLHLSTGMRTHPLPPLPQMQWDSSGSVGLYETVL